MKKFWILAWALFLMPMAGTAVAAGAFEGEVDYKVAMKNDTGTMNYFLKGKKIRMEMEIKGHPSVILFDLTTRKMMMLMAQQKMYMAMSVPEVSKTKGTMDGTFTKTGKTDTILGYSCEEWLYQGKKGSSSIWCAAGLGQFMGLGQQRNEGASAWVAEIRKKGLFPLKMVTTAKDGTAEVSMEATKIDKKSLDPSLFEPPADYQKMDMGSFMPGMLKGTGK